MKFHMLQKQFSRSAFAVFAIVSLVTISCKKDAVQPTAHEQGTVTDIEGNS
jgi:hypothetical protein